MDPYEMVPIRHRVTHARATVSRLALAEPEFVAEYEEIPADEGKPRVAKDGQPERLTGLALEAALNDRGLPNHGTAAQKRDRIMAHDAGVYDPLNDLPLSVQEG